VDRRYSHQVNTSEFIWVITSNLGTEAISHAYNEDIKELDDEARDQADLSSIQAQLRDVFFSSWSVSNITLTLDPRQPN
jgi:ATP-dependent Clp protease ATP-binding subunit ClpA